MVKNLDKFWEWVFLKMEEEGIPSIRELAKRAGVSHGTILAQKNQSKPPSVETAEGLCRALRVSWTALWTEAGYVERLSQEEVSPGPEQLRGLDAEIYQSMRGTGDDFKGAVLRTIKVWLVLYEQLNKK